MDEHYRNIENLRDLAEKFTAFEGDSTGPSWSKEMHEIADGYREAANDLLRFVPRRSDLNTEHHEWGCRLSAKLSRFHGYAITGSFEFLALTKPADGGLVYAYPVTIVVLEGSGIITLTEGYKPEEVQVQPGALIHVPADVEHRIAPDWNSRLLLLRFEHG